MTTAPAYAAPATFFTYTGADCDPDLSLPPQREHRATPLWVLALSSAAVGAAVGRLSVRRPLA
ncbi:hypothetical protein AS188_04970 [Kocuria flava]|uniref:Uncharacterized protein n=1 Tax=Kocuria flava TaxID=446860 RepID=A0A0U3GGI4_9MICC|nr:hypothetical protein [Kocuria flava]ALU39214.1 hypothetical protein AS188_04970 [Kocuria flava]MCJ8505512.1 hypothetical protein [Kocuria flava]GEO91251.1 hypothetical protein KFL01_05570 [Kocuria flava]